jgi:hypothetical protein
MMQAIANHSKIASKKTFTQQVWQYGLSGLISRLKVVDEEGKTFCGLVKRK